VGRDAGRVQPTDSGFQDASDAYPGIWNVFVASFKTQGCLPRTLTAIVDPATGKSAIPCTIVEARPQPAKACGATPGRSELYPALEAPVVDALRATGGCDADSQPGCASFSLCEIDQAGDGCHHTAATTQVGWCYIDPFSQPSDDASLVASCPVTMRRLIRFVDPANQTPAPGTSLLLACATRPIPGTAPK